MTEGLKTEIEWSCTPSDDNTAEDRPLQLTYYRIREGLCTSHEMEMLMSFNKLLENVDIEYKEHIVLNDMIYVVIWYRRKI